MRWVLMLCLFLGWAVAQAPQLTIPAVTLSSAWASVPLPEAPLGIVAHDGAFWVCGANEMIAESTDEGRHWSLRHWSPQGAEMLFSLGFQGKRIHAWGTAGTHLVSDDGGVTWAAQNFNRDEAVVDLQYGDAQHAFADTARGYATSDDGGDHWRFEHTEMPASFAVLDARRVALFVGCGMDDCKDECLTTSDGGRHWRHAAVPGGYMWLGWRTLPDGYRLVGRSAEPGADPGKSFAFEFSYASGWKLSEATDVEFNCTAQGCMIAGGWEDFASPQPRRWELPADAEFAANQGWAAVGGSFCTVGETLRCRSGRSDWVRPPQTRAVAGSDVMAARCLKCAPPMYPAADRNANRQGRVVVHVVIGTDGRVKNLALLCAPSASLAHAAMDAVRGWIYSPLLVGGKPKEVDSTITVNFTLHN